MDEKSSSEIAETVERLMIAAPRDYFLGPVFAATKHGGAREVTIGNRRYLIGGFHPVRRNGPFPPALDVRHARAIFCLLSFRGPFDGSTIVRFSFNEFCRRYARSNGGRYSRAIGDILADLMDSYIRVTDVATNISHEYRLITHIDVEKRPIRRKDDIRANSPQTEMWINGAILSDEFFALLSRIAELQHLKLDVFTAIRSPLAQAIYLYIPSRAHHHNKDKPFEISVSKLLEQVTFPIPKYKSLRKQVFTQHEAEGRSILQQLDGLETLTGKFRVTLVETVEEDDWKLRAWVERSAQPKKSLLDSDSKLFKAFLRSGRTRQELERRLERVTALDSYECELLQRAEVKLDGNKRFFELARALTGQERFEALLSEAKGDALEKRPATKNPTARLIHRIMEEVGTPRDKRP